jgi:hypothetical protein
MVAWKAKTRERSMAGTLGEMMDASPAGGMDTWKVDDLEILLADEWDGGMENMMVVHLAAW